MNENNDMVDPIIVCLLCGDFMEHPTDRQLELFGWPKCCDELKMVCLERNKIIKIIKGLDNLKIKLEAEMIKGVL